MSSQNNLAEEKVARKEAEAALLGCILISCSDGSPEAIDTVRGLVSPSDFEDARFLQMYDNTTARHARIYLAMLNCQSPDQISVAYELHRLDLLRKRDCAYLYRLVSESITSLDYEHFAKIVAGYGGRGEKTKPVQQHKGGITRVT